MISNEDAVWTPREKTFFLLHSPELALGLLGKILLEELAIDRRHWTHTLLINELISATIINLFNDIWPLPFGLKFSFTFSYEHNRTPKNQHQFSFSENSRLNEFIVGSYHILAIKLKILKYT